MKLFFGTWSLGLVLLGCGDSGAPTGTESAGETTGGSSTGGVGTSTGAPVDPGAHVVGKVDVIDLCGVEGATTVSFRATRVGCEVPPPAPCTVKIDPYEVAIGDAASCPGSNTDLEMEVVVPRSGRYYVEAQALTPSGFVGRCYGIEGEGDETLVTKAQADAQARIDVVARPGPCPEPP